MLRAFGYLLSFVLGFGCCFLIFRAPVSGHPELTMGGQPPVREPAEAAPKTDGFGDLGIRPGDVLMEVDGIKDEKMFDALVQGYRRGNVCATFKRDNRIHHICLQPQGGGGVR